MSEFPPHVTIGEVYGPAMDITNQAEADEYFKKCVRHMMRFHDRAKAEGIIRQNLDYYAGYGSDETRRRIERLFKCSHPVFGKIADGKPTTEEGLAAGVAMGKAANEGS